MALKGLDWTRWGCGLMAGAGATWAYASWIGNDASEALRCGSVGLGFAVSTVALGRSDPSRSRLFVAGLVVAALPAIYWMTDDLTHGRLRSPWIEYGLGANAAAILAAVAVFGSGKLRWALRASFAAITLAMVMTLVPYKSVSTWFVGYALALVGSAILVASPPVLAGHVPTSLALQADAPA